MSAKRTYVPAIAGLRAIAVLTIVLYHISSAWMPGGFVGVDVFFVISGFVVAHSVLDSTHDSLRSYYVWFYKRRLQRIIPAAYLYVALTIIASVLFIPLSPSTRFIEWTGAFSLVGASNLVLFAKAGDYFGLSSELNPFTHTWSLAVEEQYYLIFPFFSYILIANRRTTLRRATVALVVGACLLSLMASAWLTARQPTFAFYMLPTRFWELGGGFLLRLYLSVERSDTVRARTAAIASIWGAAALAALAWASWSTDARSFPFPGAILPCAGAFGVIALVWCHPGMWLDRLLASRLPVFFGNISYSLYLWHWGVIVMMRWTIGLDSLPLQVSALLMSILLAWLSYTYVEQRFHNSARRADRPTIRFFVGYIAAISSLMAACVVGYFVKPEIGLAAADEVDVWDPYAAPPPTPCEAAKHEAGLGAGMEIIFPTHCTTSATPRLIVIGDSHAGAYQRTLWRIAGMGRYEPHLLTMGGCRLVDVTQVPVVPSCNTFQQLALERAKALARPGDVIFLPGLHTARYAVGQAHPQRAPRPLNASMIVASRERLANLASLGLPIIVEGAKPVAPVDQYRCADWFNRANPDCRPSPSYSLADVARRVSIADEGIQQATVRLPGVIVWHPAPLLCERERCPGYLDGKPLYFDTDHLTAYGNDRVAPDLLRVLETMHSRH